MLKRKLAILIAAMFSVSAFAGGDKIEKIGSTFEELDNDSNGLISKDEADDDEVWAHFSMIDNNSDGKLSRTEYDEYMDKYTGLVAEDSEIAHSGKMHEDSMSDTASNRGQQMRDDVDSQYGADDSYNTDDSYNADANVDTGEGYAALDSDDIEELGEIDQEFSELDEDRDGYISVAEAKDNDLRLHFGYIDNNQDLKLSDMEFSTYVSKAKKPKIVIGN